MEETGARRGTDPAMIVRPETPADHWATRGVVAAAFGDEPVAELLDGMRESSAWRDLSFVAEQDGEVVGHVCYTRGWVDAPQRLVEVLVLSPLSVRPDLQRTGVGARLVEESLTGLVGRDEPWCSLRGRPTTTRGSGSSRAGRSASLRPPCGSRRACSRC